MKTTIQKGAFVLALTFSGLFYNNVNAQTNTWSTTTDPITTDSKVEIAPNVNNTTNVTNLTIGPANLPSTSTVTSTKLLIQEDNPWIELKDVSGYSCCAGGMLGGNFGIKFTGPGTQKYEMSYNITAAGPLLSVKNSTGLGLHVGSGAAHLGGIGTGVTVSSNSAYIYAPATFMNTSLFNGALSINNNNLTMTNGKIVIGNSNVAGVKLDLIQNGGATEKNVMLKLKNVYYPGAFNEPTLIFDNGTSSTTYGGFGWAVSGQVADAGIFKIGTYTGTPTAHTTHFAISPDGKTGIGTTNFVGDHLLYVGGKVICEALTVKLQANWADYVFAKEYKLRPLEEVESYIKENNHLPDVPSASEVKENGIETGEMFKIQMQKIEELTLYLLEMKKEMEVLKKDNKELKKILDDQD